MCFEQFFRFSFQSVKNTLKNSKKVSQLSQTFYPFQIFLHFTVETETIICTALSLVMCVTSISE